MTSRRPSKEGFTPFGKFFLAVFVVVAATPIVLSATVGPPASTVVWVIFAVVVPVGAWLILRAVTWPAPSATVS